MTGSTVSVGLLAPLVAALKARRTDAAALLAQHGFDPDGVHGPSETISVDSYLRIIEAAAARTGDRFFGAEAGRRLRLTDINLVGALMASARTLGGALEDLALSFPLLKGGAEIRLVAERDRLLVVYDLANGLAIGGFQDPEFTLAAIVGVVGSLLQSSWHPSGVQFSYAAPEGADRLEGIFGAKVYYRGSCTALVLPSTDLARPLTNADFGLRPVLQKHIAGLLPDALCERELVGRVRSIVRKSPAGTSFSVRDVARELRLSPRTLQRGLSEGGTSLREIVKEHRMRSAEALLSESMMTHGEIADALGYSDGTVFWRAYRSWTGHSPSESRRRTS